MVNQTTVRRIQEINAIRKERGLPDLSCEEEELARMTQARGVPANREYQPWATSRPKVFTFRVCVHRGRKQCPITRMSNKVCA